MGRPLKDKDFSEIDRMVMEGKIPDARGRQWNLRGQETGPEVFNRALNQLKQECHEPLLDRFYNKTRDSSLSPKNFSC